MKDNQAYLINNKIIATHSKAVFHEGNSTVYDEIEALKTASGTGTVNKNIFNKWYGKKLTIFGDSISTMASGYKSMISEDLNMTLQTWAVSGSGWGYTTSSNTSNSAVSRASAVTTTGDLVIFFYGTNDWQFGSVPFGEFGDTTADTFNGSVYKTLLDYTTKYPEKRVVVMTPLRRQGDEEANSYGKTLIDYVDAIIKNANSLAVPVLDLYRNSGMNTNIGSHYSYYGDLHPNSTGMRRIADMLESFVDTL